MRSVKNSRSRTPRSTSSTRASSFITQPISSDLVRESARVLRPGGAFLQYARRHVVDDGRQLAQFLANHPVHRLTGGEHAYSLDAYVAAITDAGLVMRETLGPWESVINAFPAARSEAELERFPRDAVTRRFGRAGAWIVAIPGVAPLLRRYAVRPTAGRLYTFFATKEKDRVEMRDLSADRVMVTGGGGFLGRFGHRSAEPGRGQHIRPPESRSRHAYCGGDRNCLQRGSSSPSSGSSRRRRRRHRREPREPRPLLLRQPDDGHPADGGGAAGRRREVRRGRHGLRVPEVHPGAVPRGRPLERLPGGDQRALRPRQEDAAGPGPGVPPAVRLQRHPPACR